jgi:hypothetical protein
MKDTKIIMTMFVIIAVITTTTVTTTIDAWAQGKVEMIIML